ncbi:MAG: hypothetical protein GXO55_03575 [Chloroflexi bacterium]|nr:hypothetical protein [Chloroflexota bacterium]
MTFSLWHVDVHLNRWPWQPSAFWATLIGVLIALPWPQLRTHIREILWLLLVTDALWGGWWFLATWHLSHRGTEASLPFVPYMREHAPWAFLHTHFPPGALSGGLLLTGLIFYLSYRWGPELLWMSLIAGGLALLGWWVSWVSPRWLKGISLLYGLALPLWTGGYVFGGDVKVLTGAAIGVVVLALLYSRKDVWPEVQVDSNRPGL